MHRRRRGGEGNCRCSLLGTWTISGRNWAVGSDRSSSGAGRRGLSCGGAVVMVVEGWRGERKPRASRRVTSRTPRHRRWMTGCSHCFRNPCSRERIK